MECQHNQSNNTPIKLIQNIFTRCNYILHVGVFHKTGVQNTAFHKTIRSTVR